MNNLKTTTELVKAVLQENPAARNSDNVLYYLILKHLGERNGIDVENMLVPRFLLQMKELGLPGFETVRRARQKIQQHHPELAGNSTVNGWRTVNEEMFRDYAKGIV